MQDAVKREEEDQLDAEEAIEAMEAAAAEAEEMMTTAKAKQSSMWVAQWDAVNQREYYYNVATGVSQWDTPEELQVQAGV